MTFLTAMFDSVPTRRHDKQMWLS